MPDAGSFEQSHPDLLVLEPDFGAGDDAPVALAVKFNLHVLFSALEDAHGDRVAVSDEVEGDVLAGEIGPVEGEPSGVEHDVIGEEVGQYGEASRALDPELARPGPRFDLHGDVASLDAKRAADSGVLGGGKGRFQAGTCSGVLDDRRALDAGGGFSCERQHAQAHPCRSAVSLHRMDVHGRGLVAQNHGDAAVAEDGASLERIGRMNCDHACAKNYYGSLL